MLLVYSISSEFSLSSFLKLASLMPPLYYKTIWSLDFVHVVSLMWTLIYLGLEYSQSSIAGIHREVRASSGVEPCKYALLSSQQSNIRLPVGLTIGIGGFFSRYHRAITSAIMF